MGKKALKRRLGKQVINGPMTRDEAWNRMERAEQEKRARRVNKTAGSTLPAQAVVYEPGREDEFMQSAFAPMAPVLQPTTIQKARRAAFDRQYEQAVARVREFTGKALAPAPVASPPPPPRAPVKQLTRADWAAVTELVGQFGGAEHDPARREKIRAQIDQVTGEPGITWGVL